MTSAGSGLARSAEPARHQPAEVAAEHVLLGQEELVLRPAEIVHRDDVGVVQGGQQVGLVAELRHRVGIDDQLGPQAFDHHRAAEAAFAHGHRREDLGHAALADPLDDRVAADGAQPVSAAAAAVSASSSSIVGSSASPACRASIR